MSRDFAARLERIMRDAGELSLQYFGNLNDAAVEFKSEVDLVTKADKDVEDFLRIRLGELKSDTGFLGEESGGGFVPTHSYWIVDPIDGTTGFVHGLPHYAISVALKEHSETIVGAVYLPVFQDFYYAELSGGASKNGNKLQVSRSSELINALGATGFACVRQRKEPNNLPIFAEVLPRLRGIRRLGSAAIDLCLVAEGKLDLYWEMNIRPWDIAAGALIVCEAGGTVTDFSGGRRHEALDEIVATNGHLHPELLSLIQRHTSRS